MTRKSDTPIVEARREGDQLVIVCPHCGKKHYHGAGLNVGDGDGHRAPHCTNGNMYSGYILREVSS